jgi:spore maturation protein CgeB
VPAQRIVILGLSITSSWGNGHATNFRGLVRTLSQRGHDILFLERDTPWYSENRDMPRPPWGTTRLYHSLTDLKRRFRRDIQEADAVILGSYVPQGAAVGEWLTTTARGLRVFYDIDTPVTLAKLARAECDYLAPHLIPRFDLYLSFTGGPTLKRLEQMLGSPMARAFYCMVDPRIYHPPRPGTAGATRYDLTYLGTYSVDRQPRLERLLIRPARSLPESRFAVAGPQYPESIRWPRNVKRIDHLPPARHRAFYNAGRYTLNITRADMRRAGYSPSVRLFEAAACAAPIISDSWPGLASILKPGEEVLVAESTAEVLEYLRTIPESERRAIGRRARRRILREHTAEHRALELEHLLEEAAARKARTHALATGA